MTIKFIPAASLVSRFPEYEAAHEYDDVTAFLEATKAPRYKCAAWRTWRTQNRHEADWYGLEPEGASTFDAVERLTREGWPRGAERLQAALGLLHVEQRPRSVRRVRVRRDFGAEVDITEYWRGRGDVAWVACARGLRPARRNLTIVNDAIASGGLDADTLFWRGAAVVALADKLTEAGYNVRVVSAWHTNSAGGIACYVVCKPFDAPVDMPTLAATVACPAFFRYLGHTWGNGHDNKEPKRAHGYRVPAWPAHASEILASNTRTWSQEVALDWVRAQIALVDTAAT